MTALHATTSPAMTPAERAHLEQVRRQAGECMVVLENRGVLPLAAPCRVALFGNGARQTVKGGTGSGDVNARFSVNIEEGLEAAGFTVTTKDWLDAQQALTRRCHRDYLARIEAEAARTGQEPMFVSWADPFVPREIQPFPAECPPGEVALYVLARNSGEGADRYCRPGDYLLLPGEQALLETLGKSYEKVIVLLNVGGVVDVPAIAGIPGLGALLFIGQSGSMGGHAVADVLLGKTEPSGRLSDSWARRYEDYPAAATFSHNNGQWNEEYYTEGIYVGYRYFDTFGIQPFYPFGYGLGYTTFRQEVQAAGADPHGVRLTVAVTNTGSRPGREVVQVYGSAPYHRLEKPWQVLAAFAKTRTLAPGETQTLELAFPLTRLQSYDPQRAVYLLEAGRYTIRVGRHSRATAPALYIDLDGDAVTRVVRPLCPLDCELPLLSRREAPPRAESPCPGLPVVALRAADLPTETVPYAGVPAPLPVPATRRVITMEDVRAGTHTLEELVAQLTVEEMADLCVGTAREGQQGADQIIGAAALTVPGAAGDTSVRLAYRGVTNMVNADGPAGLRLAPHFRVTAAGAILAPAKAFSEYTVDFGPAQPGETDYYQYCTAIPVASLLACSWDLPLLTAMGDLVGEEMARFGVRVWLAPGMNIHRDPLCGRNFEYFSEDPLLSGLCAAAEVRGVQHHPGAGACIKHFFANNQEDNRMSVNEHIGEQALREIYLRNFAEAIAAGDPECLMTSYNLVNGVHTANSYDAITAFAREEAGFSGYVMTDWSTSSARITAQVSRPDAYHPCASSPECIRAGNDLQMPGTQENINDIVAAVADGTLPVGYLQRCALRILRAL